MKLNELLKQYNVNIMSFPAFKGLEEFCNKEGKVVNLCTLPAELLLQQGITEYYAPVIPRGSMFKTAQEIMDADLDVKKYRIREVPKEETKGKETIIISRHWAAVDCAHELYPNVTKILLGNVTEEDEILIGAFLLASDVMFSRTTLFAVWIFIPQAFSLFTISTSESLIPLGALVIAPSPEPI